MAGIFSPFHFNVLDGVEGPPNGSTTSNVCVTYHDTSLRFFFYLEDAKKERSSLNGKIAQTYADDYMYAASYPYLLARNHIYAGYWDPEEDNMCRAGRGWYRCEITGNITNFAISKFSASKLISSISEILPDEKYRVFWIDFGNKSTLTIERLRYLNLTFTRYKLTLLRGYFYQMSFISEEAKPKYFKFLKEYITRYETKKEWTQITWRTRYNPQVYLQDVDLKMDRDCGSATVREVLQFENIIQIDPERPTMSMEICARPDCVKTRQELNVLRDWQVMNPDKDRDEEKEDDSSNEAAPLLQDNGDDFTFCPSNCCNLM